MTMLKNWGIGVLVMLGWVAVATYTLVQLSVVKPARVMRWPAEEIAVGGKRMAKASAPERIVPGGLQVAPR